VFVYFDVGIFSLDNDAVLRLCERRYQDKKQEDNEPGSWEMLGVHKIGLFF
jgi:hypothetical protein